MNHRSKKVLNLVLAALFAALICVATMVFTIPLPGRGYLNTGDCFVILAGCLMGPVFGPAASAVGSALADVILGFAVYAPGTFVIKGLMALAACAAFRAVNRNGEKHALVPVVSAGVAGEFVMIPGYFLYESALFGFKTAIGGVPGNCLQGAGGLVIAGRFWARCCATPISGVFPEARARE
jgi:uncharacterized membrane protein